MAFLHRRLEKDNPYYDIRHGKYLVYHVPSSDRRRLEDELRIVNAFIRAHAWPEQYEQDDKRKRAGIWIKGGQYGAFLGAMDEPTKPWEHHYSEKGRQAYIRSTNRKLDRMTALEDAIERIEEYPAAAEQYRAKYPEFSDPDLIKNALIEELLTLTPKFMLDDEHTEINTRDVYTWRSEAGPIIKLRNPSTPNQANQTKQALQAAIRRPESILGFSVEKIPDKKLLVRYTPEVEKADK